ncbi:carbonic anhydrase [Crassisporium funariophilum]|nr:carbonic anhydrase [Crassisporium funariophilum]
MAILIFKLSMFSMFMSLVSAHPVYLRDVPPTQPLITNANSMSTAQSALGETSNMTSRVNTLEALYQGNQKFRESTLVEAEKVAEQVPSFMFLGCLDSRLSPSTIFDAPTGSVISHNNIANQYSTRDRSAEAAIAYAIESLHVDHIIVLGHYGCKGVETAITRSSKASDQVRAWVKPITDLYKQARRQEIVKLRDSRKPQRGKKDGVKEAPAADDAGFRALVEENVKRSVNELRGHSVLTKAYSKDIKNDKNEDIDVFVHGFVYDDATGDVHDLQVSFGPPGKAIPTIPFKAVAAAQNYQGKSYRPGVFKGKTWDFHAHH